MKVPCLLLLCLFGCSPLRLVSLVQAQQTSPSVGVLRPVAQADRVSVGASLAARTPLPGHLPPWAAADHLSTKPVDLAAPLHLTILMRRAPEAQAAFEALLQTQQDPGSALYHHWLTPAEVGELYGPTEHDLATVKAWAQAQGLAVQTVAPSRILLELTGSVETAAAAFRITFSNFNLNGTPRRAPNSAPSVPTALAPVIAAVEGLADIPVHPQVHGGSAPAPEQHTVGSPVRSSGTPEPQFTSSSGNHYIAPVDFANIYGLYPEITYDNNTGATVGTKPQHIAVIDESDLLLQDIADFAAKVGIGSYHLNTVYPAGAAAGVGTSQGETTLDATRTIGTAPGAFTDLVLANAAQGGIYLAASYAVNTLQDPVLTMSWGSCESTSAASTVARWDALWSQAAAEGISVFISAGDSGAAACDTHGSAAPAAQSLATNAICSSTYATCVGGTEFNDSSNPSVYWSAANTLAEGSAGGYIPEGAWNEPTRTTSGVTSYVVLEGGGGVSKFIAKPSWQVGTGVPADGFRDTPDISFSASGHDAYVSCFNYNCESGGFEYFYGTSAAAPGMAAVAALLNTRAGAAQGNLNPVIYRLANSPAAGSIFHDATVASSGVTNCSPLTPSMCNNSTPSTYALTGGQPGYMLTSGYDQATGWGSLNVSYFLAAAAPLSPGLTLSASVAPATNVQPVTFTASLSGLQQSLIVQPTGSVQFYQGTAALGSPVALSGLAAASVAQVFTPGTYSVSAVYSGDTFFKTSTASAFSEVVVKAPPAFTIMPAAPSLSFASGASTGNTDTVTLTSTNEFVGPVMLTCSVSAGGALAPSCSATPLNPSVPSDASVSAVVTIASAVPQASLRPGLSSGGSGGYAALCGSGLAGVLGGLLGFARWRRGPLPLLSLVLGALAALGTLATLGALNGCGGSSGTQPLRSSAGSYTVTVSGTGTSAGTSAPVTASTTISVLIQ